MEIAKKYTDKVFQQKWLGFAGQRNFGLEKCFHDWILVVDADERVTEELKKEIIKILKEEKEFVGYHIPRKTYFLGKWIKHCGWYPDYALRFFKKAQGKYGERMVHEAVVLEGKAGYLKEALLHYCHRNLEHYLVKANSYTSLAAEDLFCQGKKVRLTDYTLRPCWAFFKMYFLKRGYLDGKRGFLVSAAHSFNVFFKYMKLWAKYEEQKRKV